MRRLGDKVAAKVMMRQERFITIPGTAFLPPGEDGINEALALLKPLAIPFC